MARLSVECHKFFHLLFQQKILMVQLCSSPSPLHVGKILIYAMPNAHYQKIDLNVPYTKHKKYDFLAKNKLFKNHE